jgi:hypothetical protein
MEGRERGKPAAKPSGERLPDKNMADQGHHPYDNRKKPRPAVFLIARSVLGDRFSGGSRAHVDSAPAIKKSSSCNTLKNSEFHPLPYSRRGKGGGGGLGPTTPARTRGGG